MSTKLQVDRRRLSHAYILSASGREECLDMARRLSAAVLCSGEGSEACGRCRDCRKALSGIHPDVTVISRLSSAKGGEYADIRVAQIQEMVKDSYVLPSESERKVYVIDQAETMNEAAQNAALKLLEEPPSRLVLALCTVNANALLPTVRSRCVELSESSAADGADSESAGLARQYIACLATGSRWELCRFCTANEGMDAASTLSFVYALADGAAAVLSGREPNPGLDNAALVRLCALSRRCAGYMKNYTGVKHIFGLLAVAMFGSDE